MNIVVDIFVVLVAIEFVYIFYLETLATTSQKTSATFGMSRKVLNDKNVNVLLKNQGVYNLVIAGMIMMALFTLHSRAVAAMLLGCTLVVAAYGAIRPTRRYSPNKATWH